MNQQYSWRRKNEAHSEKNTLFTLKDGSNSLMLWGCFAYSGTGTAASGKQDELSVRKF